MQFDQFKRRFAARGQQPALPTIGFFGTTAATRTRREFITLAAGAAAAYSGSRPPADRRDSDGPSGTEIQPPPERIGQQTGEMAHP